MKDGQKIMIENCAGLGDLIMFTPALRKIKELFPNSVLSIITKTINKTLLTRLPYIDHVYDIERGKPLGRIRPARHLWGQDYFISTRWQPQLAFLAAMLRIPHRIGPYQKKYTHSGLFEKEITKWVLDTHNFAADTIADNLSFALDCQLIIDRQCDVSKATPVEKDMLRNLLSKKGLSEGKSYAIIAPFTSRKERDLSPDLTYKIIKYINQYYHLQCVIIGDAKKIGYSFKNVNFIDISGETNLYGMIAALEMAEFVVASDSGPMHIACALHKPTVGVFSKDIPQRWAPKKYCFPVCLNLPCSPCGDECAAVCIHRNCINGITLEMIASQLDKIKLSFVE